MLEIFDLNRKRVAVLNVAFDVTETEKLNGVSTMEFSLPAGDEKAALCKDRYFVRYNGREMYRILDKKDANDKGAPVLTVECEHVIATLVDNILFQDHILTGYSTKEAIEYVLGKQKDWVLGKCEFDFRYDYAWCSENLLSALWSIATPFVNDYKWTFDTSGYPWVVNLEKIDTEGKPEFYVIEQANLKEQTVSRIGSEVVTRLYCLGYGEGVNQLDIREVNNDVPYLEAPKEIVDEYGIIEAVWVDRSIEDAATLLQRGKAILNGMMTPRLEYVVNVADIYPINGEDYFDARVGKVVELKKEGLRTYVTEVKRDLDDDTIDVTIANTPDDLVTSIADLADRQRIEATYSQGATQLWGSPVQDNASPSEPLIYNLWIPEETKIVNKVMVKIELDRFRAYSGTTEAAGESTETSSSDGGVSRSTASGGGGTATAKGGEGGTSSASGTSTTLYTGYTKAEDGKTHRHSYTHKMPSHAHKVYAHTHTVSLPSHTHEFTIPNHTHEVEFPAHTHDIEYGIYRASVSPKSAEIQVNGKTVLTMETEYEGDITALLVGEDGKIPRGQFLEIGIKPNALAYVTISVAAQGFIQSRGGGRY